MQSRRVMLLIIVCVVSMLGLVSLGVPQPTTVTTTVTFTSTQPVATVTGSQSFNVIVTPLGTVTVTSYLCLEYSAGIYCSTAETDWVLVAGGVVVGWCNPSSYYCSGMLVEETTYTTTAVSPFTYILVSTSSGPTGLYGYNFGGAATLYGYNYTYSPPISTLTSVTTSTVTSSITSSVTQTTHLTEQLAPIFTSSTNQMIAVTLAVVFVVSLLMVIRGRQHREKQATLTQFTNISTLGLVVKGVQLRRSL